VNSLFLSPNFPPHYHLFCRALRDRGVRVLGLGDAPAAMLPTEVSSSLDDYIAVPRLGHAETALRAAALLVSRHGRIDHIDSLNEHWLEIEARLRADFNVPGPRPDQVARARSKMAMARAFEAAGLDAPACVRALDRDAVFALAESCGYPLVFKPDVGVGAESAFVVDDERSLVAALARPHEGLVVQPYVRGRVTTYDGIVDRDGHVVHASSFVYCDGVLEIVRDQQDVFYYTRRTLPAALEAAGRAMVRAFDLRSRFFHAELFEVEGSAGDARYVPLEINMRPPGGFSTHLMNYAADLDVHRIWAAVIASDEAIKSSSVVKYHAAHVARRPGRSYRRPHDVVVRELGGSLMFWADLPPLIAVAMGTPVYVVRHEDEGELKRLIRVVHERA
jgi:biotin carboxylase